VPISNGQKDSIFKDSPRFGEAVAFLRRANVFLDDLKHKSYPNASTLARVCRCSRSTAVRTIDCLRYDFGVPLEYDETSRGYYLIHHDFILSVLHPSQEELIVLSLLSDFAQRIGSDSIRKSIDDMWTKVTSGRPELNRQGLRDALRDDPELIERLSGVNLLRLLVMCCQREL
jgi:predicted DNA-binding transcriptional regulator YafY